MTIRSVSIANVGDGVQYPLQPRLDITQTYDGAGEAAKRVQTSRLPGIIDEFGNPGEPIEDTQTTHYVKSTVLGGATVAELGWGDTIHVYAAGQRIAREFIGNVTFEHQNPMTGGWVTSHGHSSYRTTAREERDPRGAETPLSNPYGQAGSYVDWRFSQPLFIEGGDPFDYTSGREIDGLPVTEAEFQRRLASGSVQTEYPGRYAYPGRPEPIKKPIIDHGLGMYEIFIPSLLRDDKRPPGGWVLFVVQPQEPAKASHEKRKDCYYFADIVGEIAGQVGDDIDKFDKALWDRFANSGNEFSSERFKTEFQDFDGTDNQARHYVGGFHAGYQAGLLGRWAANQREMPHPDFSGNPPWRNTPKPGKQTKSQIADTALNAVSTRHGLDVNLKKLKPGDLKQKILDEVCDTKK